MSLWNLSKVRGILVLIKGSCHGHGDLGGFRGGFRGAANSFQHGVPSI